MKINVTQEHINNGRRCASHGCPIALAVLDAIPLSFIAVGNFSISYRIESDNELGNVALPRPAYNFIGNYDDVRKRAAAKPFSFELELPGNGGME